MRYRIKLEDGTITEVDAYRIAKFSDTTKRNIKAWHNLENGGIPLSWSVDIYFQADIEKITDDHGREVKLWK